MTASSPIVVVGGGPAGSVCARQLARLGYFVRLLTDDGAPSGPSFGQCARPSLQRALARCGLTLPLPACRPLPTFLSSWGSDDLDGVSYRMWQTDVGHLVDRPTFDQHLLAEAASAGVDVVRGARVSGTRRVGTERVVTATIGGREAECPARFVVEATGRASRSMLEPRASRLYADRLVCVSVAGVTRPAQEPVALVESADDGWWYAAQDDLGRAFASLFVDADRLPSAPDRPTWFSDRLHATRHVRHQVAIMGGLATPHVSDARTSIRRVLWRGDWLAIGDAAWALDPLSGSGLERAISDGWLAAEAIAQAIRTGSTDALRAFALARFNGYVEAIEDRCAAYRRETRFAAQPFWRRRSD